jgi:hypothetical protein
MNEKRITPDQIAYNAKLQLQRYIESFFHGPNRQFLSLSSPISMNYNLDHTTVESKNVKERKLQVARYFNELKNILPAIVLTDGQMRNISQSIGLLSGATGNIFDFNGVLSPFREITINLVIGSNDIQTTDILKSTVSSMFNEFRNLAGGHYMIGDYSKGENWVVTLPNAGVDFGGMQDTPLNNDPTDRIFYVEASFNIFYEDSIQFNQVAEITPVLTSKKSPVFDIPAQIPFNQQLQVKVKYMPADHKITVSNYKLATISPSGVLTPRGLGKVVLKIVSVTTGKIALEKEIEIIY